MQFASAAQSVGLRSKSKHEMLQEFWVGKTLLASEVILLRQLLELRVCQHDMEILQYACGNLHTVTVNRRNPAASVIMTVE